MIFSPIGDLEVYNTIANRYGGMLANIRIDGITIYGAQILTKAHVSSGKNTIGAFESSDKRSLVAWIDPISGKFISLRPDWLNSPLGVITLSALLGGLILSIIKMVILFLAKTNQSNFALFITFSIMILCLGLIVFCMKTESKISPLETQLRRELENTTLLKSDSSQDV